MQQRHPAAAAALGVPRTALLHARAEGRAPGCSGDPTPAHCRPWHGAVTAPISCGASQAEGDGSPACVPAALALGCWGGSPYSMQLWTGVYGPGGCRPGRAADGMAGWLHPSS